jgi:hypothetical protein
MRTSTGLFMIDSVRAPSTPAPTVPFSKLCAGRSDQLGIGQSTSYGRSWLAVSPREGRVFGDWTASERSVESTIEPRGTSQNPGPSGANAPGEATGSGFQGALGSSKARDLEAWLIFQAGRSRPGVRSCYEAPGTAARARPPPLGEAAAQGFGVGVLDVPFTLPAASANAQWPPGRRGTASIRSARAFRRPCVPGVLPL